jgi:hypothetical protein
MNMNTLTTAAVAAYSQAVRDALHDLSPTKARTILEGLDEHLFEIAEDSATDLETTLGSPQAYAAELRASAGLDTPEPTRAAATEPAATSMSAEPVATEPVATTSTASSDTNHWPPPREHGSAAGRKTTASGDTVSPWQTHTGKRSSADVRQLGARIVLGFVFGLLAIIIIRMDWPLNGVKIIGAVLLAVGLNRLLRAAGKRADLPQPLAKWLPGAIAIAALATAVLLGGQWARSQQSYRFGDSGGPGTTVFATVPAPALELTITVPDLKGSDASAAAGVLRSLGFRAQVVDLEPGNPSQRVTRTDPAAGEIVSRGSAILVVRGGDTRPATSSAVLTPTTTPTTILAAAEPTTTARSSVPASSPPTTSATSNTTALAAGSSSVPTSAPATTLPAASPSTVVVSPAPAGSATSATLATVVSPTPTTTVLVPR